MKKIHLVLLLFVVMMQHAYSQDSKIAVVPANLIFLFAGSWQPSVHLRTSPQQDWLVLGWNHGVGLNSYGLSGEEGLTLQYRFNVNRDANVVFKANSYFGFFFEYASNTKRTTFDYRPDYRRGNGGFLFGSTIPLNDRLFLDLYLGLGIMRFNEIPTDNYPYTYDRTTLGGTGGLSIGLKL